jgi:hypothetical protein
VLSAAAAAESSASVSVRRASRKAFAPVGIATVSAATAKGRPESPIKRPATATASGSSTSFSTVISTAWGAITTRPNPGS